jgi:hypothetical protein
MHKLARLTPTGRYLMVERLEAGETVHGVAEGLQVERDNGLSVVAVVSDGGLGRNMFRGPYQVLPQILSHERLARGRLDIDA